MNVTEPSIEALRVDSCKAELVLDVPEYLDCFEGHFPGVPIVPGVVQICWAVSIARRFLDLEGEFVGMHSLKFHQVIRPNDRLSLTLEYYEESGVLCFAFSSAQGRLSRGHILLGHAP